MDGIAGMELSGSAPWEAPEGERLLPFKVRVFEALALLNQWCLPLLFPWPWKSLLAKLW